MRVDTYTSRLPIEECRRRLQQYDLPFLDREARWMESRDTLVFGKVRGDRFRLWASLSNRWRNAFRPFFHGRFAETPTGTQITGTFGMHAFTRIYMSLGFAVLGYLVVMRALYGPLSGEVVLILGVGAGTWGGIMLLGKRLAKGEKEAVREFICKTLEASREPGR